MYPQGFIALLFSSKNNLLYMSYRITIPCQYATKKIIPYTGLEIATNTVAFATELLWLKDLDKLQLAFTFIPLKQKG